MTTTIAWERLYRELRRRYPDCGPKYDELRHWQMFREGASLRCRCRAGTGRAEPGTGNLWITLPTD